MIDKIRAEGAESGSSGPPVILASTSHIPQSILQRAEREGFRVDRLQVAAEADLSLSGVEMPIWLLANERALWVAPIREEIGEGRHFRLEEFEDIDLRGTVGSTCLRARIEGAYVEIIRFTNAHRERFQRVLVQIKRLKAGKSLQVEALTAPDEYHCAQCGMVLTDRNAPCGRCLNQGAVFARTLAMLRPYFGWVAILFGIMVVGVTLDLIPNLVIRFLLDDVLNVQDVIDRGVGSLSTEDLASRKNSLLLIVLVLVGAALMRQTIQIAINRISAHVGTQMTYEVRRRMFDKLTKMTVDYYDRTQVGSLMSRITGDVESFHGFVSQVAQGFFINIFMIVGILGMLFYLNPHLAPFVLIPMPFVVAGTLYFWKKVYPRYFKLWDSNSKLNSMLNGVFSGIRLVKSFSQEARESRRFDANVTYLRDSRKTLDSHMGTFNPIMTFIFGMGGFIVWYVGGRDILADAGSAAPGTMTIGSLIAYLGYIAMLNGPLQNLTLFSNWVSSFVTSSHRIFEVIDNNPSLRDRADAEPLGRVRGNIEFRNVTFGYDPYNPILHNVSLDIEAGATIGIVGRSGSGKTTIINLVCRFYDPQEGEVLLDGRDLRDMRREDLRRHVGLVLQEPFLFRATVSDNIAYGKPEAEYIEILNASRAANCHDFIMRLPSGYDTRLGERGAGLSGGERQRVSIARALLCDPDILILDEATSSVDTESETQIQEALAALCKGRTTIAIAHRLTTLRGADKIYVIDNGRVAESGSHRELMERGGIYFHLVEMQTQLASLEA
ncbi:MAG: ABC transporter ATP-binding protein [Candidatus Omnitrophica bacterium]|nr:ABC transporter ATP-binding protein [Candidatus Omnitrophota bacterium]